MTDFLKDLYIPSVWNNLTFLIWRPTSVTNHVMTMTARYVLLRHALSIEIGMPLSMILENAPNAQLTASLACMTLTAVHVLMYCEQHVKTLRSAKSVSLTLQVLLVNVNLSICLIQI